MRTSLKLSDTFLRWSFKIWGNAKQIWKKLDSFDLIEKLIYDLWSVYFIELQLIENYCNWTIINHFFDG